MSTSVYEIQGADQLLQTMQANPNTIILVDFWATRCGPCQMLKPILHNIAEEHDDVIVCAIEVDQPANQQLAQDHQISSIPRVKIYYHTDPKATSYEPVDDFVGALPPDQIVARIEKIRADHAAAA